MRAKFVDKKIIAYHVSIQKINNVHNKYMWFAPTEENVSDFIENGGETEYYIYKVKINGNILSLNSAKELFKILGINYDKAMKSIISDARMPAEIIPYISDYCDGFYQPDCYGVVDENCEEISILVFNPEKNVKIIKEIFYENS